MKFVKIHAINELGFFFFDRQLWGFKREFLVRRVFYLLREQSGALC